VPWKDCSTPGDCPSGHQGAGDANNPNYQQRKYPERGGDIPLVKATEMRLIEAEALLRQNDLYGAMAKIREVRAYHSLDPLTATGIGNGFNCYPIADSACQVNEQVRDLCI